MNGLGDWEPKQTDPFLGINRSVRSPPWSTPPSRLRRAWMTWRRFRLWLGLFRTVVILDWWP